MIYVDPSGRCSRGGKLVGWEGPNGSKQGGEPEEGDAAVCEEELPACRPDNILITPVVGEAPPPPPPPPSGPVTQLNYTRPGYVPSGDPRGFYVTAPIAVVNIPKSPLPAFFEALDFLVDHNIPIVVTDAQGNQLTLQHRGYTLDQLREYGFIDAQKQLTQKAKAVIEFKKIAEELIRERGAAGVFYAAHEFKFYVDKITEQLGENFDKLDLLNAALEEVTPYSRKLFKESDYYGNLSPQLTDSRTSQEFGLTMRAYGKESCIPITGNMLPDQLVLNGQLAELDFYGFKTHFWTANDTLSAEERGGLYAILNALRTSNPSSPVRIMVVNDGASFPNPGYLQDIQGIQMGVSANGEVTVLLIRAMLRDSSLAGKLQKLGSVAEAVQRQKAEAEQKALIARVNSPEALGAHLISTTGNPNICVVAAAADSMTKTDGVEVRRITSSESSIIVFQLKQEAQIAYVPLAGVTRAQLDVIPETTASAVYDPAKKTLTASFVENGTSVPAKKAHIARVSFVGADGAEKNLAEGTDYTINPDGTITLTTPKTGKYRVYLQISGYPLDTPAEVEVGVEAKTAKPKRKDEAKKVKNDDI